MKKLVIALLVTSVSIGAWARGPGGPGGPCGPRPGPGPHCPPPAHHHHHHGCSVAGAIIGAGLVGAALYDAVRPAPVVVAPAPVVVAPAPVVVTQPVVVQPTPVTTVQNVWVEGRYIDQVQANGTIIRVWQPGHYEQRTVIVQ